MGRVIVVTVCLAAAGCGGIFADEREVPERVRDTLTGMAGACEGAGEDTRLRATAIDPDGAQWDLWVASGDPLGVWVIVPAGDAGNAVGSFAGAGCIPQREVDHELTVFGGMSSPTVGLVAGRLPDAATALRVDNGRAIRVDGDGFYVVAVEGGLPPAPVPIEALDADGDVVGQAETT